MGLFDKKYCDICGEKIGLLGNRKLEDGNLCKECAKKLSPWFSDRRNSTVEEIRSQLNAREENKNIVATMKPNKILGNGYKVYIDEAQGKFFVTRSSKWKDDNPDIFNLADIANVAVDVDEHKDEIYDEDKEGNSISFDPPRYEYEYTFDVTITMNHPYVDEVDFELTDQKPDSPYSDLYRDYERQADELLQALVNKPYNSGGVVHTYEAAKEEEAKDTWKCECGKENDGAFCPDCGKAKPTPVAFCSNCGAKVEDPANPPKFCSACGNRLA